MPPPSSPEERAELESTLCYDMALQPVPLRLCPVFPSHLKTTSTRAAYFNALQIGAADLPEMLPLIYQKYMTPYPG